MHEKKTVKFITKLYFRFDRPPPRQRTSPKEQPLGLLLQDLFQAWCPFVYILLVLLYGSNTWSVTEASRQRLDAFGQWCLRRILRVPCTAHVTNVSMRSQTNQPPVSSLIQQRRLKLFGHSIARAAASEDHSRALRASTDRLPPC